MASAWQIVDLSQFDGRVTAGKGALHVGDKHVPLVDISVILTGLSGDYHPSVIERSAAFEIPILHLDWRGVPVAVTLGWKQGSRVAARHRAQASLELPRSKNAWMRVVKAKIRGQAVNLLPFDVDGYQYLQAMSLRVRSGDVANLEGQAARFYWSRLFEDPGFRRIARTRSDINGMLDYGYTILRGAAVRAVLSAGLWPTLGIWHRQRDNCFALADDLMEPFRPVIDSLVLQLSESSCILDKEGKRFLASSMERTLKGSGYTVSSEINKFAHHLARYIEGDARTLEVPQFGGLDENG